jgi:hypothetical protein
MYLVAFSLLSVLGAWLVWRQNPLFSTRATLRFIGVVGLTVAAVICATVAAANFSENQPVAVGAATLFATVLAGTLALIWVIVAITAPPVPALPPSAKLTNLHRAKVAPWTGRFGWMVLVFALLGVVLPGDFKFVVLAFGGMFVFIGIVLLFTGYLAALNADRSLTSVESDPWVHWRYTPEQWKAWDDVRVARFIAEPDASSRPIDWRRLALPLVAIALGVFVFDPGDLLWKTLYTLISCGFVVGLVLLAHRAAASAPRRLRKRLSDATPEAYFGQAGLLTDGVYTQWLTVGNYLLEATVDEREPRSLVFRFEIAGVGTNPSSESRQYVLIPAGAENDIARLQSALSAACPKARIALV